MQELRDIELIAELDSHVLPFDAEVSEAVVKAQSSGDSVMDTVFQPLVEKCDILFFRALPDGRITAGVAREIQFARELSLPVLELPSGVIRRTMNVAETREYLRESGEG
ncbi:MAG TPA: hypothetical protein ENH62_02180 [Marinobacter sp.]|nr:hypothetical protein [Marinobacter sp.]